MVLAFKEYDDLSESECPTIATSDFHEIAEQIMGRKVSREQANDILESTKRKD